MSSMDTAQQALAAIATDTQVRAHNVANVNTGGFKASRAEFESGPGGEGVRVAQISQSTSPGPAVVSSVGQHAEGSNTDVATEMVGMITDQHAYAANAAVIRTEDENLGTVVNLKA